MKIKNIEATDYMIAVAPGQSDAKDSLRRIITLNVTSEESESFKSRSFESQVIVDLRAETGSLSYGSTFDPRSTEEDREAAAVTDNEIIAEGIRLAKSIEALNVEQDDKLTSDSDTEDRVIDIKALSVKTIGSYKSLSLEVFISHEGSVQSTYRTVMVGESLNHSFVSEGAHLDGMGLDSDPGLNRSILEKAFVLSRADLDEDIENKSMLFSKESGVTFTLSDDENEWAMAFLAHYGLTSYRTGSFRTNLVIAYISADMSNQRRLQSAFPGIAWVADVCANVDGGAEFIKAALKV